MTSWALLKCSKAQAAGFGPLQEGLVLNCSSALVRQLLASPPPPVRVILKHVDI